MITRTFCFLMCFLYGVFGNRLAAQNGTIIHSPELPPGWEFYQGELFHGARFFIPLPKGRTDYREEKTKLLLTDKNPCIRLSFHYEGALYEFAAMDFSLPKNLKQLTKNQYDTLLDEHNKTLIRKIIFAEEFGGLKRLSRTEGGTILQFLQDWIVQDRLILFKLKGYLLSPPKGNEVTEKNLKIMDGFFRPLGLAYEEDFSTPYNCLHPDGPWAVQNGALHFKTAQKSKTHWLRLREYYDNYRLSARIKILNQESTEGVGFLFGETPEHHYIFLTNSINRYVLFQELPKRKESKELSPWKYTDLLQTGYNTLTVICAHSTINCYINGQQVVHTIVQPNPDGFLALLSSGEVEATFDDFAVTPLSPEEIEKEISRKMNITDEDDTEPSGGEGSTSAVELMVSAAALRSDSRLFTGGGLGFSFALDRDFRVYLSMHYYTSRAKEPGPKGKYLPLYYGLEIGSFDLRVGVDAFAIRDLSKNKTDSSPSPFNMEGALLVRIFRFLPIGVHYIHSPGGYLPKGLSFSAGIDLFL